MRIKKLLLLKPLQQAGLGVCPHISHHGTVQGLRTVRAGAMAQPLMQLPDRITNPCKLERTQGLPITRGVVADPIRQAAS